MALLGPLEEQPQGRVEVGSSPDILPIEQAEEADCHHVPVGAVVVAHQVQGQCHM